MKKSTIRIIALLIVTVTIATCFTSCSEPTYTAASEFFWSSDAGKTYGNKTKEYAVGENVYMQLNLKVESSSKKQTEVGVTLTIPYIKDVVSKYMDGQIITPEVDEINQTTTYKFTVIATKDAQEWSFTFQFVPTKATDVKISLEFDEPVNKIYNKQNTIVFIERNEKDGEE